MGKRGLWTSRVLIVFFWASLFVVSSLAEQARLPSGFGLEAVAPLGRRVSAAFTDLKLAFRGPREPWNKILLVEIDERPLVPGAPGRWPWRREVLAALITRAFESGAKSVGVDLAVSEADPALAEVIRTYGGRLSVGRPSGALPDPDGVSRFAILEPVENGKKVPSLAFEMATHAKGSRTVPLTAFGAMEISFRGPEGAFPHVSSLELLIPGDKFTGKGTPQFAGVKKTDLLKDAYVLIAQPAKPGSRPEWSANVLDNLLSGDALAPGSAGTAFWFVLLVLVLGAAAFTGATARLGAGSLAMATIAGFGGLALLDHQFLFSLHRDWGTGFVYLELLSLSAATGLAKWLDRRREQTLLRAALEKFVAPAVARSLAQAPSKLDLSGEKREATVLVTEIDGFDALAEAMDPKVLTVFLREYLSAVTGAVFRSKGTVGSLHGARITAFWGAPLEQRDHAVKALQAALEIMWLAKARRDHFRDRYGVDLSVRLGLASGTVVVGHLGPDSMFSYSAVGEAVSLASRITGVTRDYGVSAVMTRLTLSKVQESGEASPHHRVIDELAVVGKNPIELVQLLDERLPAVAASLFTEGRELCRDGRWEDAISRLERANQALGGDDGPSRVLLQRCRELRSRIA